MIELVTEEPQKNKRHTWRLYWFHESDPDASCPADADTLVKALLAADPKLRMQIMLAMPDKSMAVEERRQRVAAEARATAAETELAQWEQLVADSAPLTWIASGGSEDAHEWEKRAADMLTKRAKLLSLTEPPAPVSDGAGGSEGKCGNPVCSLPAGHEKNDDEICNDLLSTDRCPQCDVGVRQHRANLKVGHGFLLCVHPWHKDPSDLAAATCDCGHAEDSHNCGPQDGWCEKCSCTRFKRVLGETPAHENHGGDDGYDMTGVNGGPFHRDVRGFVIAHGTRFGATALTSMLRYIDQQEAAEREVAGLRDSVHSERVQKDALRWALEDLTEKVKPLRAERDEAESLLMRFAGASTPEAAPWSAAEEWASRKQPGSPGGGGSAEAWVPKPGDRLRNYLSPTDLGTVTECAPEFSQFGTPVIWDKSPGSVFYVSIAQLVRVIEPANPEPPKPATAAEDRPVRLGELVAALDTSGNEAMKWLARELSEGNP